MLTRALPVLRWVLLVLAVGYAGWTREQDGRLKEKIAATEHRIAAREQVISVLVKQKVRVDTVASKASARYLTIAADYRRLRDSLSKVLADSLDKGHPYVKLVEACDAALFAADTALSACAKQVAIRDTLLVQKDSLIVQKDSLLHLERKRHPGRFTCAAGASANNKGVGLGVTCGIRIP